MSLFASNNTRQNGCNDKFIHYFLSDSFIKQHFQILSKICYIVLKSGNIKLRDFYVT